MSTAGQAHSFPPLFAWLSNFLRAELRPYPGRATLALRYTLAATITMLVIITFRIPGAAVGGFYSLLLPRTSLVTTLRSALSILMAFASGLAFLLVGAILFVDYPITHFLWVVGSFFVAFYGLSVLSNYGAASAFAIVIVLLIPAWDQPLPQDVLVTANLWTSLSVAVAILATVAVESTFALFQRTNPFYDGIDERLEATQQALGRMASQAVPSQKNSQLEHLAMTGVSRLRKLLINSDLAPEQKVRLRVVVSIIDQLVDLVAVFEQYEMHNENDVPRMHAIADQLAQLRRRVKDHSTSPLAPLPHLSGNPLIFVRSSRSSNCCASPSVNIESVCFCPTM